MIFDSMCVSPTVFESFCRYVRSSLTSLPGTGLLPSNRNGRLATTKKVIADLTGPVALRDYEKFLPPLSMLAALLSLPPGDMAVLTSLGVASKACSRQRQGPC